MVAADAPASAGRATVSGMPMPAVATVAAVPAATPAAAPSAPMATVTTPLNAFAPPDETPLDACMQDTELMKTFMGLLLVSGKVGNS
jgi:hypothetical protein